jgi:hypothetical protein
MGDDLKVEGDAVDDRMGFGDIPTHRPRMLGVGEMHGVSWHSPTPSSQRSTLVYSVQTTPLSPFPLYLAISCDVNPVSTQSRSPSSEPPPPATLSSLLGRFILQ